mmetsp:Transcript_1919/g.2723  ORF Transcript_1919/g.2723 Transcript_1919/m.2723 type:complete len:267 (-) Transcript_1919:527-1327(-)
MLRGLISRCMNPLWCSCCSPLHAPRQMLRHKSWGRGHSPDWGRLGSPATPPAASWAATIRSHTVPRPYRGNSSRNSLAPGLLLAGATLESTRATTLGCLTACSSRSSCAASWMDEGSWQNICFRAIKRSPPPSESRTRNTLLKPPSASSFTSLTRVRPTTISFCRKGSGGICICWMFSPALRTTLPTLPTSPSTLRPALCQSMPSAAPAAPDPCFFLAWGLAEAGFAGCPTMPAATTPAPAPPRPCACACACVCVCGLPGLESGLL